MLTLAQLTTVKTAAQYRAQLLSALQGIGHISKTGTGSASVVGTGVAVNGYSVRVQVTTAGILGTAAVKVSTDGGATYAAPVTLGTSGALIVGATGLTLLFADGPPGSGNAFEVGDTYAVELTIPTFPATAWQAGSVPLTLVEADAVVNQERDGVIADIASGGFLSTATGAWLTLLAREVYRLERIPAAAAVGNLVLTNTTNAPVIISIGQVWAGTVDGRRFNNTTGGTLPALGTLTLPFRAETVGENYNIDANGITTLYSALPGVTVNNPSVSWRTSEGRDEETDAMLRLRCIARWPTLSATGGTRAVYEQWALSVPETPIVRVYVRPSPTVPGEAEVFVASSTGPVGSDAVDDAQEYLEARVAYPSTVLVQDTVAFRLRVEATVNVYAGSGDAAMSEAAAALSAHVRDLAIGDTLYYSNLIEALSSPAGVRNVAITALKQDADGNGSYETTLPLADVVLAETEVFTLAHILTKVEV